jgi:HAD superfamily hydrolase (TIGR01484 family)
MKLDAIFSDYDGTLCPLELRREEAIIAPRLLRLLTKASKQVRIGIVTTKDLDFVKNRVPFAQGIAATCGLQIWIGGRIITDERVKASNGKIEKTYKEILARILQNRQNIVVERKETDEGQLMAFCIDWRLAKDWDEAKRSVNSLLRACSEQGLYVDESNISPFANVYPMKVDKGEALTRLRTEMDLTGPILYLGDSEADNAAFQVADISVGVKHTRIMPPLQCKYRLEFLELENFLFNLENADFDFRDEMLEHNLPQ